MRCIDGEGRGIRYGMRQTEGNDAGPSRAG